MLPRKPRHHLYAVLLLAISIVCTSGLANTRVYELITEIGSALVANLSSDDSVSYSENRAFSKTNSIKTGKNSEGSTALMFMTIIQGADEEVICANDGSTVARFNLCGNFDDRVISLSGGTGQWQRLVPSGACTFDTSNDCPSNGTNCNASWQAAGTSATFNLVANTVPAATGGEYRVRVGTGPWFYFKVTKSTILQNFNKTDFICGRPGQIQIVGLNSSYEYSINGGTGFGPWQGPIFNNLLPGTYNVLARQQGTPGACEYPYAPITILQQDISIDVTFVDALCSGDTGSISVMANNVPGPYRYTLLNAAGIPQEFTAFLSSNTHTFSAVGFGTYIVQVETQQCTGDPLNGIDPPRQDLDTGGNPIVIGNGLAALDAFTEVNSSFGCSTISSVDITVNTSGGQAPYSFSVNGGPSQPSYTGSTIFTVTSGGTYDFFITDANGCTITASSNVETLSPPNLTASGVDGTCSNGGARINFNVINANGYNLSYRVNGTDPWDTNPSISVAAGTYNNLQVLYQQGAFQCTLTLPAVTVTAVGVINGSATKIADRTCNGSGGVNGGQIDFGPASGGSGSGYVFSIDGLNFSAVTSYANLVPGTYTPMVEDGGGCRLELTPILILDVDPPTDIAFVQSNSNCTANTSDVQLTGTSSAAITNYSIVSPISLNNGTNATFVGLSTTTSYIFRITDANNCTYTEGFTPSILSSIRARVRSGGDTQVCNGASDGSGTFLIDGFTNNYTYNINGGTESAPQNAGEVNLTGLNAGTYTITITDADTGCTDTASFTVNEAPVLTLGGNVTPMSCANNNLGRVVATTTGGWGNNRYTLIYPGGGTTVGPRTSATFGNLSVAGTYTLNVQDAEGCTATFAFDLTPIASPTIALDAAASDFCFVPGIGASITVSSTAGTAAIGSHQYRINGGALQASPVFAGLSPGNYTIQVVDGNNCSDDVNVTVNPQLRVNTSIETEIPCGGADGQIRVQVLGGYTSGAGTKQYEVSLNGGPFGGATPLTSNNFIYSTNVPGDYIFRATDNQGCTADSNPLTLNPPASIAAPAVSSTAVSCGNTSNGTVTIIPNATVGIAPYEVSFNGGAFTAQTIYSNLGVGTYAYTVRDARGCIATGTVDVLLDTTPTPDTTVSEIQANCSAGNIVAGGIQIDNVTDGNENFSFIIEDIFGNQIVRVDNIARAALPFAITNPALVPGNYRVITLDLNGCNDIDTVTITTPDVVITPIPPAPPTTCDDSAFTYTVQVTPTIFPVTPTYQIRIQGQPAFYALNNIGGNDFHQFSNATDGIQYGVAYTVEVLAPNGCIYEQEIPPIDGFSDMDITATSGGAFCDNNGNGRTDFTVVDFLGPDLFIELIQAGTGTVIDTDSPTGLTGGLGSSYSGFFNVQPGAYTIRVTDSDTCTDATTIDVVIDAPRVDVLSNISANCNALGQLTYIGSGGNPFSTGSPYLYAVVPQGNPVTFISPTDTTDDFSEETTRVLPGSVAGIVYDVWVIDSRGCTFNVSQEIIQLQPDLGSPTFIVDNQCDVTSTSFDIVVSVPGSLNTPRFTLGGDEQFGVLNGVTGNYEYTYTVSSTGSYVVDVVDANGCNGQGIAIVYDFLSASGSFTTQSTCNAADGEITIVPVGGSGDFEYLLTGTDYLGGAVTVNQTNNAIFIGMAPGNYQVLVTDNLVTDGVANCSFLVNNIVLDAAILPIITPTTPQDVTCNGQNDGSIDIILQAGTDVDGPMTYRLLNFDTRAMLVSNNSGSFPNLVPGRYEVEVVSIRNCTALSGLLEIIEPPVFAIGASAADFACEPGANRFSSTILTATITSPGSPTNYRYSITGFENYQTSPTFEIVDNGSVQNITVYAIDSNGCEATASVTINPPMDVIPSIVQIDPLNCRDPERVRIQVVGTGNFTVTTLSAIAVAPVTNTPGNDFVDVFLPEVGDYFFEVQDNEPMGCVYPMPMHTVISPILPTVSIGEASPVQCFGGSDGALSIEVADYTGQYIYNVFSGSDPLKTTPLATGTLDTANNPEIISGLPGGNFFVEVVAIGTPFCSADSNIATIRTPNGPLVATAVEVGNVSCNNNTGIIEALASGGWDTSAYVYGLMRSTDGGATYTVSEIAAANPNEFENLQAGFYQVQVSDVEGCTATFDIELQEVPQIDAGIREPQGLVCPNGNNAILEAFDPTSGTAITATAGASGGFPGAGYNYRLLYLNSNDNTDIASSSGLQNTPTFVGASGGFISGGWYAIEVSSSFDCVFVTAPYFVNPPPPIQPRLVQTRVPGCGGDGEMRLFIENHDPSSTFEYEYRRIPTPDPINDPYTDFGPGVTSILISAPGSPAGINYQYEVRKKNASNTCLAVNSNGVTMTDAVGITLLPNSPVNDISCASELDGRIESFIVGGVGNEMYTLYIGQPTDGFNPGAATVFRGPQNFGTFEGVPEGTDYWIGVTSGATCEDTDGPFTVVRPEPILYNASSTPVLCNGDANGTITLEVSSGGVGLIQFAIAPNFNEFFSDPANPGNYTFDDLLAGSYEVLIQDENGCFERAVVAVSEPAVLSATLANTTPETCIGFEDGSAQLSVTGGTPFVDPLTFAMYFETRLIGPNSDGSEVFVRNDNLYFDNLAGGQSYIIEIRDVNNCLTDLVVPIVIGVDLSAEPLIQYGCDGIFPFSTTTIIMQDTSLLPDLMFALDPLDPTDAISANAGTDFTWGNLSAGNHTVYIYHQNGCTISVDFIMEAYDPLTLDAVKTGPNEITATAEGGFGNYEFFFQGESFGTENSYTTNESTLVTVEVRDQGGCVAVVTIPFEFTGMLEIPNFFTPDGDNNNDVWYPRNREFFPFIDVKIYDRYGRVVAELNQVTSWDGTYDGNELPSGDYWYVVNANDKSKIRYVGHFTLYR